MNRQQLSEPISSLTPALEVQRERGLRTRRGHKPLADPGTRAKATPTPADRVLVTLPHLRKLATMNLPGQPINTTATTINCAVKDARPLLEAHGHPNSTSTPPPHTSRRRQIPHKPIC